MPTRVMHWNWAFVQGASTIMSMWGDALTGSMYVDYAAKCGLEMNGLCIHHWLLSSL